MPRSGKNAMKTPMAKARAIRLGRVLQVKEDAAPFAGAGSLAAGSPRRAPAWKWSCEDAARGASIGRPPGAAPRALPASNSPTTVTGRSQITARSLRADEVLGRHREQELVVLAPVEGQSEGRRPRVPARAPRPWGSTGTAEASTIAATPLASHMCREVAREAVREVDGRVDEVLARRGPGRRTAAARVELGAEAMARRRPPRTRSRPPCRRASPSSSRRAPCASSFRPAAAAPSVPVTTTRSPGRAPRAAAPASPGRAGSRRSRPAPRVRDRLPPTRLTPVSAARSRSPSYRPSTKAMRELGGQAEAHDGVARHARHGRDVREVDARAPCGRGAAGAPTRAGSGRPPPGCRW